MMAKSLRLTFLLGPCGLLRADRAAVAAARDVLAVETGRVAAVHRVPAAEDGVPGTGALDGHPVHDHMVVERVVALRDVDDLALRLARVDRRLDLGGRVGGAGRVGPVVGDRVNGPGGLGDRRADLLEVGQVDGEGRRLRGRGHLHADLGARRVGGAELRPGLVVEVVRVVVARVVVERVTPVVPAVLGGDRQRLDRRAVGLHVQRGAAALAVGGVGKAVAQRHRVRGRRERELHVLPDRVEGDRLAGRTPRRGGVRRAGPGRSGCRWCWRTRPPAP